MLLTIHVFGKCKTNQRLTPLLIITLLSSSMVWMQGMIIYRIAQISVGHDQLTPFHESLESPKVSINTNAPTIRGMLAHWTGPINLAAYKAWIVFHHKRWNVTDVDLYVHWELEEKMNSYFSNPRHTGGANVHVFDHYIDKYVSPERWGLHRKLQVNIIQRTLEHAKQNRDDFVFFLDADEFLESNDFETIDRMFVSNETTAVTFPTVDVNYDVCSGVALDYGSLGYQSVRPVTTEYINDATKNFYTDPRPGYLGHRKYIARPDHWDFLGHIHDPVDCDRVEPYRGVIDMTGRAQDKQHVLLLHLRKDVGIHADTSFNACSKVSSCKLYDASKNTCIESLEDASPHEAPSILLPSMMQKILSAFPLFDNLDIFVKNATMLPTT